MDLKSQIEAAVQNYLLELCEAWETELAVVRIRQVESRLLDMKGIVDVAGTTINGVADNLYLTESQIPAFGGVAVVS